MAKFLVYLLILIMVKGHIVLTTAESQTASRKLGRHNVVHSIAESKLSPSEAPKTDANGEFLPEVSASGEEAAEEEVMKINHHHRSVDKSVAGGGVIVGGLATTFLVAVFCYIRATGRKQVEPASPMNSDSSVGRKKADEPTSSPISE